jgi:hypothetical protein
MPAIAQSDQNDYDAGKTPAQLFASDCGICHKSPVGLVKDPGVLGLGLQSFLRSHYTASSRSATAIAGYLMAVEAARAPSPPGPKRSKTGTKDSTKDSAKDSAKGAAGSKADAKSGDKPTRPKPSDAKASEPKGSDAKAPDSKPGEAPVAKPADKPN